VYALKNIRLREPAQGGESDGRQTQQHRG
jgi:hypothetical protein